MQTFRTIFLSVVFVGIQAVFAGPEADFDAAVKAGETLTAEAAYQKLVKDGVQTDPIRHFQAAEVARQMGRETLRRDRLAYYLRAEKKWTAMSEEAAWYLCLNGGSAEQFDLLCKAVPASGSLFAVGRDLINRARDAKRGQEACKLADILLGKFPARRREIFEWILGMRRDNISGLQSEMIRDLLLKHPLKVADMGEYRDWTFRWHIASRRGDYPAAFVLEWSKKLGEALPAEIFSAIDQFSAKSSKKPEDIEYRAKVAKLIKEVEPIVFKPGNGAQANELLRNEIRLAGHYFKPGQTNEQAATYYDLFKKTIASYEKDKLNRGEMMRRAREMWDQKILTAKTDYWQKLRDEHPEVLDDDILISWSPMRWVAEKAKNVNNIKAFIAKNPSRAWEARRRTRDVWIAVGETKQVMNDMESEFVWNAAENIDGWGMLNTINSLKLKEAEKIAFLKKVYVRIGAHSFFNWIKKDKGARDRYAMFKTPEGEAFVKEIDEKKPAGDVLVRYMKEIFRMNRESGNLCPARGHEIMAAVFADYKAEYPQDGRSENGSINRMIEKYYQLCRDNMRSCEKFAEVLIKGYGKNKKANWWYLSQVQWNLREKGELWYAVLDRRAEVTGDANLWDGYRFPENTDKLPASADLEKMGAWQLYTLVRENVAPARNDSRNKLRFTDALTAKVVSTAFRRFNMPKWDEGRADEMLRWLGPIATNRTLMAQFPYDKVADETLNREKGWRPGFAPRFIEFAAQGGRRDGYLKQYLSELDKIESYDRVHQLIRLLWNGSATPYPEKAEQKWFDWYGEILRKNLLPTLKSVPNEKAALVYFFGNTTDWMNRYGHYFDRCDIRKGDKAAKALNEDISCEMSRLVCHGARGMPNEWGVSVWRHVSVYYRALAKTNQVEMVKVAHAIGSMSRDVLESTMLDLVNKTAAEPAPHALYLLVNSIPGNANGNVVALAARLRADVSRKLPGVYPVGEKDPAYPLYVAADELSRKNSERAWQILQDPRNQAVFEREVLKLPPDFVVWGVEQLRMARGNKDALLLKARQIATAIIAQESKVSPEVVAAMILTRAESYRDQQNFEAAKLEYQSIRDNSTYHATKYGKQAMFRAIDLQIVMGNAQGVEQTLEYWLSQNDREIQAEAHYFLARLAFDRKDYDECIKQLRQVFAINYTHTGGRFLQGEWKLATNSEVDDTEVLVGKLGDRNMIKPGNEFTITVQDANLSVAGGGASIPVIVRTKPGNDEERVNLYPTSRDPSNFKGLIGVVLGKANPSNRVIEVRGNDTVSYEIDPVFLKERGLPLNKPKELHVIDDAKVAIGAGAPRTDEKKTEKGLKDLLEDERAEDTGVTKRLRPGNPLYVVVQDRDCSRGGEADTVRVTVETTSGDRLEGFELKEENPFTGVFRGKIETSLPPPRAFASDTAVGLEPGDVINANKNGGWKSLADGQPGKWFEVDTMDSSLFSEITLETPSVVDIKSIKLVGHMGSRDFALGQLPAATPMSKLYLRRQQQYQGAARSLAQLRAFCQTDKAAKPYIVTNISFRVLQNHDRNESQTAYYRGPFEIPEGVDSLRLRISPKSSKKDALRTLSVTVAIDGEEVFSGQGFKLQDLLIAPDVTAGCHHFELAVSAQSRGDEFDLLWEPLGKEPEPLPSDWFDAEQHASLTNFVKDLAQIVKTETGFKAVFDTSVRLRSFRWEFADAKCPEIAVTRISAKGLNDAQILPVQTDFSESRHNQMLEVAPGDNITVTYEDERTTSGEKKVLQRRMSSSFNDATVRFIFEDVDARGNVTAYNALRFQPGDSLVMSVEDPDCDTSDEADSVEVTIKNRSGETFVKKLLEVRPKWAGGSDDSERGVHSGIFMGVLKTCLESNTNAPAKVLRVKADDLLTLEYEDRENTDPGVPCSRTARIFAARPSIPVLTLFDVTKAQEIDRSADAKVKLERIRRRPGNENVQVVYRDVLAAEPMDRETLASTNAVLANVSAGLIPVRVNDRSRARHSGSRIMIEAVAHSERAKAEAEGRDPEKVRMPLMLAGSLSPLRIQKGIESAKEAQSAGTFNGLIRLSLGPLDPNAEVPDNAQPVLRVTGSDAVDISVLDADGNPVVERTLKLVSDGTIGLMDSSFAAERLSAHIGESFFVMVDDADRDATDEPDKIEADVQSSQSGISRKMILTETMPHSGVFTGRLRPVMFAPGETIPSVSTGGVASAHETLTEERFAVKYGDRVIFRYRDEMTLPGTPARTLSATGSVFRGANGEVRLFSKRFADRDTAVLVQFRLAECLFEQAKEHRKLKQAEKSAAAIAEGKLILEEALKNYPDSTHVVQGEYLLANLYQELATEQKDAGEMEKATPLYQEALSRFSQILGTWPDSEYAARSQYHKAYCLEMLKDYNRASEEYVKMTYIYPESELVSEATIRLAQYYFTKEKRYDVAGHIYRNFQQRFPQHQKAPRVLFMAGSCYIKQAEALAEKIERLREQKQKVPKEYEPRIQDCNKDAIRTFLSLVETYHDSDPKLRAQALYWAGDVSVRVKDYTKAYQYLKRTVFEFPETEWARRARGLLLQEGESFKDME